MIQKDELEGRLDPLYYANKVYSILEKSIYASKSLEELSIYLRSGFPAGANTREIGGVIQIRPTNIDEDGSLGFNKNVYLKSNLLIKRKEDLLQKGEVLFNNTNSQEVLGKSAFFEQDGNYFCSNHITRIRVDEEALLPEFLWVILNVYRKANLFFNLCTNWNNQSGINIDLLKTIPIPVPSMSKQRELANTIRDAYQLKGQKEAEAKELLDSIDEYVLRELGIRIPKLESLVTFTVSSEEAEMRVDPYYHQPKFKDLYKVIQNYREVYRLKDIVEELDYGLMPTQDYAIGEDDGIPMVRVTNIFKDGTIDMGDIKYIPFNTPRLGSKKLKKDDILMVQCGSTTGKVALVPKQCEDYTFGSFSFIIRGRRKIVDQYYLFAILANILSQEQIKRTWNIVTVRPNTSKPSIRNLLIPLPDIETQHKIGNEVQSRINRATQLKHEAKKGVEKARAEVEKMILGE